LGFSGYVLDALSADVRTWLVPLALATVILLTLIVLGGLRRSNLANTLIVSLTLLALAVFVAVGLSHIDTIHFQPFFADDETGTLPALLHATALMFVAYTGYGRVATLGEEVHNPRRTIPRAVIATLVVTMLLYMAVAFVGVGVLGAPGLAQATAETSAPLEAAAATYGVPAVRWLVTIGAMTAMLGVLLNLILGLSRVLLAMGRRGDMPPAVAKLNSAATTPFVAVIVMGVVIGGLVLLGNVRTTWSFSAFTVLMYYSLTNLSALRLKPEDRLFSPLISLAGLIGCLFLAFWVEPQIWLMGIGLIVMGWLWQSFAHTRWSME
jgi:APA family basic amino acid/polyamine antiporter